MEMEYIIEYSWPTWSCWKTLGPWLDYTAVNDCARKMREEGYEVHVIAHTHWRAA